MDEQHAQVSVAALADAQQLWSPARRSLARYQTQPPPTPAVAMPWHRRAATSAVAVSTPIPGTAIVSAARRHLSRHRHQLRIEQLHAFIQALEFLAEFLKQRTRVH